MVGTEKKSMAAIPSRWFRKKVSQRWADSGLLGACRIQRETLRSDIFATATVVFLGYSVSDQYLVDLLSDNERDMSLFGAGPHFVVSTDFKETPSVRRIGYSLKRFPDHRAAMTVLDLIRQVEARKAELAARTETTAGTAEGDKPSLGTKSAYFISDFTPPGTWSTASTLGFKRPDGTEGEAAVGLGFTNDEMLLRESTAPHDLIVGLICFDVVYFPLSAAWKVFLLLGDSLWDLVQSGVIRLIHLQHDPSVMFSEKGALIGGLGLITLTAQAVGPESPGVILRRTVKPTVGKEAEGEKLISEVESRIVVFAEGDRMELANLTRAAFMNNPDTRKSTRQALFPFDRKRFGFSCSGGLGELPSV